MASILGPVAPVVGSVGPGANPYSVAHLIHNLTFVCARVGLGYRSRPLNISPIRGARQIVVGAVRIIRCHHDRLRVQIELLHERCVRCSRLNVDRYVLQIELRLVRLHCVDVGRDDLRDHSVGRDIWVHSGGHTENSFTF